MITHLSTYKKIIILATALTVTTACSALEDENAALLVEKHAEFILKNKAKIESHFEIVIKVLESEKYKKPILRFIEESNAPIKDFVLVKALKHFGQSPFDLVLDAHEALNLPRSMKSGNDKLSKLYVIPFDPSYIGALTTAYQLSPSAVEKATEAVEFLIPLYSILFDTLLQFDGFDDHDRFRYANGSPQIQDGVAPKWSFLGSSDARLNDDMPLVAFFPILLALNPSGGGIYTATDALGAGGFKHLNISQLKLLEKVYDFINDYSFYWYGRGYKERGENLLSSIQVAIEKSELEVVDFSDLGIGGEGNSNGAEESSGLDFSDLEL